jgi:hypothetical protein
MGDDVSSDPRTLPTPRPPPARADDSMIRLTHCGGMAEDSSGGGSVSSVRATLPPWLSSS